MAGIDPQRRSELIKVLDIDLSWRLHKVSDGRRRRVQICMGLLKPYKVLLLDEITVDLDVLARADLLKFLRRECEERGATIIYAMHIFDGLEDWPSHIAYVANGKWELAMPMEKVRGISKLSLMSRVGCGRSVIRRGREGRRDRRRVFRSLSNQMREAVMFVSEKWLGSRTPDFHHCRRRELYLYLCDSKPLWWYPQSESVFFVLLGADDNRIRRCIQRIVKFWDCNLFEVCDYARKCHEFGFSSIYIIGLFACKGGQFTEL